MILKYEEYIKEGLWSKGIERSKSGEVRNEDKFIQNDISIFNKGINNIIINELSETISDYRHKIYDVYDDFTCNYAKQHGTLDLGFTSEDEASMPDFDFVFHIPSVKNVKIHVIYLDQYKDFKVMCGNNKDEFDITNTILGQYLFDKFKEYVFKKLSESYDILKKNIERNWDIFKEVLYNFVYDCCHNNMEYVDKYGVIVTPIGDIEIDTFYTLEPILQKFFFDGVDYSGKYPKTYIAGVEITHEPLGKKIIELYKQAYDDAKKKFLKK